MQVTWHGVSGKQRNRREGAMLPLRPPPTIFGQEPARAALLPVTLKPKSVQVSRVASTFCSFPAGASSDSLKGVLVWAFKLLAVFVMKSRGSGNRDSGLTNVGMNAQMAAPTEAGRQAARSPFKCCRLSGSGKISSTFSLMKVAAGLPPARMQAAKMASDPGQRRKAERGLEFAKQVKVQLQQNNSPLFEPFDLGPFHLSHRIVHPPLTRLRAINCIPQEAHETYYAQRATPGGLIITEASAIAPEGIGLVHTPGIWSQEQIEGWRRVVQAVHAKGAVIFCQIWHVGRASHTSLQPNGALPVSSTGQRLSPRYRARLLEGKTEQFSQPRALALDELPGLVDQFRQAARNAMTAGFDGVEIHAAHGYLIDQFLKSTINDRRDMYGGSLDNRCRFALEVVRSVVQEIGGDKTGVRISPYTNHLGALDGDPRGLGLHLVHKLNEIRFLYLHMTEPRFPVDQALPEEFTNLAPLRQAYRGVVLCSGGFTRDTGGEAIENGYADLVGFGKGFIANPDLPLRFYLHQELNECDYNSFYTHDERGYTDYPFLDEAQVPRSADDTAQAETPTTQLFC